MSLTRIMSTTDTLAWCWIPSEMESAGNPTGATSDSAPRFTPSDGARAAVLRYARRKLISREPFQKAISDGVSDDVLIGMLSDASTAFFRLWIFVDVQLRVRTFYTPPHLKNQSHSYLAFF